MVEPFFRFSNRCRSGSFLRLHLDTYKTLTQKKDIMVIDSRSLSFMTVRLSRKESKLSRYEPPEHVRMELEIPNPVFALDSQDCPIKLDDVTSNEAEISSVSYLKPQCSAKESNTSSVRNVIHAEEDLDPTQLDFLAQ